jgi:hypothetical protein
MSGWCTILAAAESDDATFRAACAAPRAAQLRLLRRILCDNAACEFGRAHGFDRIDSLADFRERVPIRRYDEIRPWIEATAEGACAVLTAAPVVAFEETGGSVGGAKLIPYTAAALCAFRAAVLPWLADLARRRPAAVAGRAYVAVSPATRPPRATAGGVPIGLSSEGTYLGDDLAPAVAAISAVPGGVSCLRDVPTWRFATLLHLLAAEDLSFVSVWSPTFLVGLVDALPALAADLVKALHDGTSAAGSTAPNPARARLVETALARSPIDCGSIWPRLDTISAWADGSSRSYAQRLAEMFPHAHVQPKGLLATEGAVTIPRGDERVPALTSALIELIDEDGIPHLCDELVVGATYRVVLTTPGGLYRYDLGDRVRCDRIVAGLPSLAFVGRADVTSDLVGEKLTEEFVAAVLSALDRPACLVARAAAKPFYALLVQSPAAGSLAAMAEQLDRRLCGNPQYAYARAIGQLGPIQPQAADRLLDRFADVQMRRGRRLADIKPPTLIAQGEIADLLAKNVDSEPRAAASAFSSPSAAAKFA